MHTDPVCPHLAHDVPAARARRFLNIGVVGVRVVRRVGVGDRPTANWGLGDEGLCDDALVGALVERPELLQRPIVERGERAVPARPVEGVLRILD